MTEPATRSPSLATVGRQFWTHPSPWVIASFLVVALLARALVGPVGRNDVALFLGLLAVQPLVEWVVHVTILHFRPRRWHGRSIDFLLARKHREHHADPRDPFLVYIPWQVFFWLLPLELLVAFGLFGWTPMAASYLVTAGLIGLIYEWTHFLVHSDYRPRRAFYRGIWRHHRLHHFKNERYWMAISRTWPDRVLRTSPDPRDVPISPTVRNLHAESITG